MHDGDQVCGTVQSREGVVERGTTAGGLGAAFSEPLPSSVSVAAGAQLRFRGEAG